MGCRRAPVEVEKLRRAVYSGGSTIGFTFVSELSLTESRGTENRPVGGR